MKKIISLALLALMVIAPIAEAGRYGGGFSGSRSFSSSRSYSSPSRSYYRPSYSTPRPVVRNTTVIQQNHVTQSSGGGTGFFGTVIGSGLGSYIGNRLAQPSPQPAPVQPQVQPQYPLCPLVIPAGWNTPCIPQVTK
jgi:hypothetical protein